MSLVLGVDVSTWQGRMDFQKAYNAGARFALIRAGSANAVTGAIYTDFQFVRNRDAIKDSPLRDRYGFYWFIRVNHNPLAQADYLADLIIQEPYTEPYVVDFETADGIINNPELVADRIILFVDRMEHHGIPLGPGDIYTRTSIWNTVVARRDYWRRMRLHIARYVARIDDNYMPVGLTGPWSDGKFIIRDWSDWNRWQFSADGNLMGKIFGAESNSIDLNLEMAVDTPEPPSSDDPLEPRVVALEAANIEQGAHLLAIEARLAAVKEAL